MAKEDYYSLLGIERTASEAEIKKAYRRLAMKHHPDRNAQDKGAEKKFKAINEAYEVLSNPQKRQAYDMHGLIQALQLIVVQEVEVAISLMSLMIYLAIYLVVEQQVSLAEALYIKAQT